MGHLKMTKSYTHLGSLYRPPAASTIWHCPPPTSKSYFRAGNRTHRVESDEERVPQGQQGISSAKWLDYQIFWAVSVLSKYSRRNSAQPKILLRGKSEILETSFRGNRSSWHCRIGAKISGFQQRRLEDSVIWRLIFVGNCLEDGYLFCYRISRTP